LTTLTTPAVVVMRRKAEELREQYEGERCNGRKNNHRVHTTTVERRQLENGKKSFVEGKDSVLGGPHIFHLTNTIKRIAGLY
jgi:hypothetical protein